MNVEAIEHHLDEQDYTLTTETLLELGACEAAVDHQPIGFRVYDNSGSGGATSSG